MDYLLLEMKNIVKRFPGVLAIDDVSIDLKKGEVLALVGENGAGKSTLMKILSGAYKPDSGEIILDSEKIDHNFTPGKAINMGISTIYQEFNYLADLSVAENIFLGRLPKNRFGFVNYNKLRKKAKEIMDEIGLKCNPSLEVKYLSVAKRQLLEIAKAVSKNVKIIIMDEPTAPLNNEETEILFSLIKKLILEGKSIIYISHRIEEIFKIAQRVVILRDGRKISVLDTDKTNKNEIVKLMVGREIKDMYPITKRKIGEVILEVNDISDGFIKNVSFNLRCGEILGLFGLMGSGRTKIVEAVFGKRKIAAGTIKVNGNIMKIDSPRKAIKTGLGYVPSDRKHEGLILMHSVTNNISLASLDIYKTLGIFLNIKKEKKDIKDWINKINIKVPNVNTMVESLSGGNQQKVVIAKWMNTKPAVLIMNEPTRGIDVGAKVEVYKLMESFCENGLGIIMISSELPEIMAIADRIITI
ncbi:MAG: sugar ABC transporter ATP-binding protein, partial [Actinomycetota bacterium]|nr:sugar ABC transporter ATP-binding protein [Actinomycetota bacterium]